MSASLVVLLLVVIVSCAPRSLSTQVAHVENNTEKLQLICTQRCEKRGSCDDSKQDSVAQSCEASCVTELAEHNRSELDAEGRCLQLATCTAFEDCENSLPPPAGAAPSAFRSALSDCGELCRDLAGCEQIQTCAREGTESCEEATPAEADPDCVRRCESNKLDGAAVQTCLREHGCDDQLSCMLIAANPVQNSGYAAGAQASGAPGPQPRAMPGVDQKCTQLCDRAIGCSQELVREAPSGDRRRKSASRAKSRPQPDSANSKQPSAPELLPELTGARVECGLQCTRELALNGSEQVAACLAQTDCEAFLDCAKEL